MSRVSPTAEGFRAAFRRPSLTFGEISWRWAVGATAIVLFFLGFFEYLRTLPVSNGELLFLRSRQPLLVWQAIAHILRGSLSRGVMSLLLAALLLSLLWMIAASLGRIATVGVMLEQVRGQLKGKVSAAGVELETTTDAVNNAVSSPFLTLFRLNFLRVVLAVAVIVALTGAAMLAGSVSSDSHPRPGLVFLIFVPLVAAVCLAGSSLNWLLSLAGMFAVRDREDPVGAISAAATLCRERPAAVAAVSTWTGLAHLVVFVGATSVVSVPLAFAGILPWRLVALGVIVVALAYFAVADWIYTARLAGYVCIAEMPDALMSPPPVVPSHPGPVAIGPLQTTIDLDEPILGDVPHPASV